jgi:hypothetical protein
VSAVVRARTDDVSVRALVEGVPTLALYPARARTASLGEE